MSTTTTAVIALVVIFWILCAMLAAQIAGRKGLSPGGYFLLGLVLGLLGVAIAAIAQPARPAMPPGWYADPWRYADQRWFDGRQWTAATQDETTSA